MEMSKVESSLVESVGRIGRFSRPSVRDLLRSFARGLVVGIGLSSIALRGLYDLLLDLESPLLLGEDYAPAPPASPPALLLPETRGRASSI